MKCECCGKELDPNKKGKYCSKACYMIPYNIKRGTNRNPNPEPTEKICVICGKPFKTRREATTTCGHECALEKEKRHTWKGVRHQYDHTWDEWVKLQRKKKEEAEAIKKIEKRFYEAAHTVEKECAICGTVFYCLDSVNRKTCSSECSQKFKRAKRRKDDRIPKDRIYDRDINNHRLYVRDKGICWLCGGACEWDDVTTTDGKIRYGNKYPSVDHIIPISLNGTHSWDNVRLAHLGCNISRSNTMVGFEPIDPVIAYQCKAKSSTKRTIQKTLDGQIVRVWESTAQIKRELHLNDGRIQEVCRGNGKSAFGFRWEYEV